MAPDTAAPKAANLARSAIPAPMHRTAIRLAAPRRSASTPMTVARGMPRAVTARVPRAMSMARIELARARVMPSSPHTHSRLDTTRVDMARARLLGAAGMPRMATPPVMTATSRATTVRHMPQATVSASPSVRMADMRKTLTAPPKLAPTRHTPHPTQPIVQRPRPPHCPSRSHAWSSSCSQTPSTRWRP